MRDILSKLIIKNEPVLSALRKIPGFRWCAKRMQKRLMPNGYRLWFQVQDGVGKGIWLKLDPKTGGQYFRGQVERCLQKILQDNLRPGMVFYDIGSNSGFFSLVAARIVGPTGRVVAFEAEPRLGTIALGNIDRNGGHNVRLVQAAVWSHSGFVDFHPADTGISPDLGLGKVVPYCDGQTFGVSAIALDDFVQTDRPPNLIKCDVEGAEVEVFRGATKLLSEYRPSIECEIHSKENGILLCAMFEDMSYDVKWISTTHFFAAPKDLSRMTTE